jgi:succinoglycan biosynthesis transport protein ExoP
MNELQPNNPEMGMKDFMAVLRRRIWVILPILLLCLAGAYEWTLRTPPTWRAETTLKLVPHAVPSGNSLGGVQAQADESIETQLGLIKSSEMARRTLYQLKNEALVKGDSSTSVGFTQDEIQDAVKVTNPADSALLYITADATNREQARLLANAVAHAFAIWKQDDAQKAIKQSQKNLTEKVTKAKTQLDQADQKETQFKQAHHLADLGQEEKTAIEQQAASDATVLMLNAELASAASRLQNLDTLLRRADAAVSSPNGVPDDAFVQRLQSDLSQLKSKRADAGAQYTYSFPGTPTLPSLATLDAQIKDTQRQLDRALKAATNHASPSLAAHGALSQEDAEARVQYGQTQAKLAQALQAQQTYQQTVQGMPGLENRYDQLHRASVEAERIYTSYNEALSATKLESDQVSGNIQIEQGAIAPFLPYKPNLKTNLLLGLALGTLLSLGLVMLLEQMDQRVRTLDEVRALVSGPIIGMLPRTSRGQMNALAQGRLLPQFEEAFSLVRVNLSYVMRHSMMREQVQHQTILVTSAVPGEGKSVTAAELARSMAEAGKSVILVDANLRRPSQNILFQTGETGGLTDVLSGQLPLDEAIATSNVENLSILNSGVSNQNPTVLLSQPRLASVMEELRYKADVVIVDAPDCTSVADTLLLTAHADCLLHVVRAGFIDMETLHNASLALHATGKKVTVLANGLSRPQQRAFKSRFAYAALSSNQSETPALPQTFEKTMVMNRSRDLVFSKSAHKSLENPEGTPEKNEAS